MTSYHLEQARPTATVCAQRSSERSRCERHATALRHVGTRGGGAQRSRVAGSEHTTAGKLEAARSCLQNIKREDQASHALRLPSFSLTAAAALPSVTKCTYPAAPSSAWAGRTALGQPQAGPLVTPRAAGATLRAAALLRQRRQRGTSRRRAGAAAAPSPTAATTLSGGAPLARPTALPRGTP